MAKKKATPQKKAVKKKKGKYDTTLKINGSPDKALKSLLNISAKKKDS